MGFLPAAASFTTSVCPYSIVNVHRNRLMCLSSPPWASDADFKTMGCHQFKSCLLPFSNWMPFRILNLSVNKGGCTAAHTLYFGCKSYLCTSAGNDLHCTLVSPDSAALSLTHCPLLLLLARNLSISSCLWRLRCSSW